MTLQHFWRKVRGDQNGFSLIEMIVVVGIISLLAAVIVPNIGKFIGTGEQGAKDAEAHSVQNALHAMMSERILDAVDPPTGINSINTWTNQPKSGGTDVPLYDTDKYLREANTVYYYCYNAEGFITRQDEIATLC